MLHNSSLERRATQECLNNYICYSLPQADCAEAGTAAVTDAPPTTMATTEAQTSVAIVEAPAEDEAASMPIVQVMVAVCGSNYNNALQNICTNRPCPNGDVSSSLCTLCLFSATSLRSSHDTPFWNDTQRDALTMTCAILSSKLTARRPGRRPRR